MEFIVQLKGKFQEGKKDRKGEQECQAGMRVLQLKRSDMRRSPLEEAF